MLDLTDSVFIQEFDFCVSYLVFA